MSITEILKTGTTTVAMICKDGVILAADEKATMGHLVASKVAKKIYKINNSLAITTAGSVGDAQALVRILKAEIKLFELQEKTLTTRAAATLLANILRSAYKSYMPELVQLILGGFDERGPKIYTIGADGSLIEEDDYVFTGSGSVIAVGVLEDNFTKDMSINDGINLLVRSIKAARERDVYSGGRSINVAVIKKTGMEWINQSEVKKLLN